MLSHISFIPRPRVIHGVDQIYTVASNHTIGSQDVLRDYPNLLKLQQAIKQQLGYHLEIVQGCSNFSLSIDSSLADQAYVLEITADGVNITGGSEAGVFYGICTLKQIMREGNNLLSCGKIEDYPDYPVRGVMLDVSRDMVPTMDTLKTIVNLLADLKINRLELYAEHTFNYRNHPQPSVLASPLSGEQILELQDVCQKNHIELVPNQNCFGHMRRWLGLHEYKALAEAPEGFDWPWGGKHDGPFSLNPLDPKALELIEGMFDEMLPYFASSHVNVGCDETFDLGCGTSKEICEQVGKGRVYLDFLLKIYAIMKKHNRVMNFWGDIVQEHPELVPELPKDVIALEWGYDKGHPWEERLARLKAAELPIFVCPGTSAWATIAGRTDNCIANLKESAVNGLKYGAIGYLITDWGDYGHLNKTSVSYLGYAVGAAYSWTCDLTDSIDIPTALSFHVFNDLTGRMGYVAYHMGNAYLKLGKTVGNCSMIWRGILPDLSADELKADSRGDEITVDKIDEAINIINDLETRVRMSSSKLPDAQLLMDEWVCTGEMLKAGCYRLKALADGSYGDPAVRLRLSSQLRSVIGEHQRLWMERAYVGGLRDSVTRLWDLMKEYGCKESDTI